jgi:GT2 family glycosyltransferase
MVRAKTFAAVEGFNTSVVAGEEPEMCLRIRRLGYKILRISEDMAWHDAAMTSFGQWFRRAVRSGHAYAQGAALHGLGREKYCLRECARIWLWALVIPILITTLAIFVSEWFALGILLYAASTWRTARAARHWVDRRQDAWIFATACAIAKFPQLIGQWIFITRALRGKGPTIIEHKSAPGAPEA